MAFAYRTNKLNLEALEIIKHTVEQANDVWLRVGEKEYRCGVIGIELDVDSMPLLKVVIRESLSVKTEDTP